MVRQGRGLKEAHRWGVMGRLTLKHRHPVNKREARELNAAFTTAHDLSFDFRPGQVEIARAPDFTALLEGGQITGARWESGAHLTVRGLLARPLKEGWVQVDMGAVPYVHNGANVMAAGINATAPDIRAGQLVWVREERHHRPLAVGEALLDGTEMVTRSRGKAVRTLHYLGDTIWEFGSDD